MKDISFDLARKDSIIDRLERLERKVNSIQNSSVKANSLDQISYDLGLIKSGAFWATQTSGEPTSPEFTGVFMDSAGQTFGTSTYQFGGATGGTLQWGGRITDATLTAGAGVVNLGADGIKIVADELTGGTTVPQMTNIYKTINADGEVIGYVGHALNAGVDNIGYFRVIGNAGEQNAQIGITADGDGYTNATIELNSTSSGGVVTIGGAGQTLSSNGVIYSGTYTPTITDVTNIDSTTANECMYYRIGKLVHVSGHVIINATTTATDSEIGISLPIASSLTQLYHVAGNASSKNGADFGSVQADATNNRAALLWNATSGASLRWTFEFTYQVL